jgi:hypothetical protein
MCCPAVIGMVIDSAALVGMAALFRQDVQGGSHTVAGISLARFVDMANKSRHKVNQPPTGEGKNQSPHRGEPQKLMKRSEVLQAQRHHPELNLGDADEEAALREGDSINPKRPKAGR